MRETGFRIISDGKIIGYEKIIAGDWKWMCPELNPDNWERWSNGSFPTVPGKIHFRDQSTGVSDKNKIEIFENDIIATSAGTRFIVVWDFDRWKFKGDNKFKPSSGANWQWKAIEIIGNIHESPDLIKGGGK